MSNIKILLISARVRLWLFLYLNRSDSLNFIEIIKAILFGIVQGITEWLPVSSTGHMILLDEFITLNFSEAFVNTFLVVVQLGSILAVVVLYFHKLNPFSPKKNEIEKKSTLSLWGKVAVAIIPSGVVGLLFDDLIDSVFYKWQTVAITLILYGILFILIENQNKEAKIKRFVELDYKTAFLIGAFQILALIPGTSRSGSTILGAVILGASRTVAAEFSFFMAVPTMFLASAYKLLKAGLGFNMLEWTVLITGTVVAFIVSVFAIKFLMNYIKKHDFKVFGYYRIVLGILVTLYFLSAGVH